MDDCVVIDIETSGVNSSTSKIIGISAVLLKDGIVDGLVEGAVLGVEVGTWLGLKEGGALGRVVGDRDGVMLGP